MHSPSPRLDLPERLVPDGLEPRRNEPRYHGMFGRLMWHSHFATLLTDIALNSRTTRCAA